MTKQAVPSVFLTTFAFFPISLCIYDENQTSVDSPLPTRTRVHSRRAHCSQTNTIGEKKRQKVPQVNDEAFCQQASKWTKYSFINALTDITNAKLKWKCFSFSSSRSYILVVELNEWTCFLQRRWWALKIVFSSHKHY